MTYPENTILFCAPDEPGYEAKARGYILDHGLTAEDVRLVRTTTFDKQPEFIMVRAKREIILG